MTSKITKIQKYKDSVNLKEYYAKLDTLSQSTLSEADRFYLKNFGIYNSVLKPEHFMLRVRVAGGDIKLSDLEQIIAVAKEHNCAITLTSRAQIELQNLTLQGAISAHKKLQSSNITSFATLTDNIRNIVKNPLDGVAKDAIISTQDIILKMQKEFIDFKLLGKLPRKFNTAICGNLTNTEPFFANDCYFALAKKHDTYGFKLYLGGKNTNFAKDVDIFVTKDEVAKVYRALIWVYIKYGNRASRTKARLYYLLEELGVEGFRAKLEEFLQSKLQRGAQKVVQIVKKESFYELKDGKFAYCYRSNFGDISIKELSDILDFAKSNKCQLRLSADQNIYIIGLNSKDLPIKSSAKANNFKVCVGLEHCGFSIYNTKEAADILDFSRLNSLNIRLSFSGCLKGCARHITADIGFVGIRTNLYGQKEHAVRLYLGSIYKNALEPARLIYWAVPLRWLQRVIDAILDEFQESKCSSFEEFSSRHLSRFSNEYLALHFLKRLDLQKTTKLTDAKESKEPSELYQDIKELEKRLYTK
jgi:ferredoxin-nitrite reductase